MTLMTTVVTYLSSTWRRNGQEAAWRHQSELLELTAQARTLRVPRHWVKSSSSSSRPRSTGNSVRDRPGVWLCEAQVVAKGSRLPGLGTTLYVFLVVVPCCVRRIRHLSALPSVCRSWTMFECTRKCHQPRPPLEFRWQCRS